MSRAQHILTVGTLPSYVEQSMTFGVFNDQGVIARLPEEFQELSESPDAQTVFVKLRELRNRW